jgi:SAM-dependent methyltransferase
VTPSLEERLRPKPAARYVHPRAAVTEADRSHDAALDVADEASPNYLHWIAELCRPHLGGSVLEMGAGIGSITELYAAGRKVLAVDLSAVCVQALERRFGGSSNVRVQKADLRELPSTEQFDSVLMINVLEHIEDDVGTLASLKTRLRPGGSVVLYVPALNGLFGAWDRKVGHYRRYSKWRLRHVLQEAGLSAAELMYVNALAIPAWVAFSRTDVNRTVGGGLSLWDRTGVPVSRFIESRVRPPIGLNLFCVARQRS